MYKRSTHFFMADDMIKKIIVLTDYPFNQRDCERFGISSLRNKGFDVEIWDITLCLYKKFSVYNNQEDEKGHEGLKIFREKTELIRAISSLDKNSLINCFVEYSLRTYFLFRTISRNSIKYCVVCMVSIPNPLLEQKSMVERISSRLGKIDLLRIDDGIRHILNKILLHHYYLFGIAPASIVLLGGEKSQEYQAYPMDESTKRLWTHSLDYDIFLRNKTEKNDPSEKFGVFLDEYLPFHPDYIHLGIDLSINSENYYSKICSFFERVESKLNTKIVIAAHPRSNYNSLPDFFNGRIVIRSKTAHLVRNSSFVIAHMSTSINFAVLYRRPILFIMTDELQKMISGKNLIGLYINAFSLELGKIPINIDQVSEIDWNKEMKINEALYLEYEWNYIKKAGTPELPVWDIYSNFILEKKF